MHMQKEELAVVVLMLCAAVAACTLAFVSADAPGARYTNASKAGDVVYLEGLLLHKENTVSGGHTLLTVKWGTGLITIFVPAGSASRAAADAAKPGNVIYVQGKVQDYKGQREIAATSISVE